MKTKPNTTTRSFKRIKIKGKAHVGIDLHDSTTSFGTIDGADGILRDLTKTATTEEFLINQIKRIDADEVHVAIEETALTHWAVKTLRPWCTSVISCDPKQNHWISRSSKKSDENDCEKLARLHRLGELKEVYHTDDDDRYTFKVLVQHSEDLKTDLVRAKNKVKMFCQRMGLPDVKGEKIYHPKNRPDFLTLMPNDESRIILDRYLRHIDFIAEEVKEAQKAYETFGKRYPEIEHFMSIPGVGPVTSHTFSAIIQDPRRFESAETLNRYACLAITDKSSDGKSLGYQRLDKSSGNPMLKQVSYRIFLGAAGHENEIRDYYHKAIEINGGNKRRARLTTQRKILETLLVIWKSGAAYDPARFVHGGPKPATQPNNRRARRAGLQRTNPRTTTKTQ